MASSISAGTTSATALVHTADTTGILALQSNNGVTGLTLNASQALGVGSTPSFGTSGQVLTSAGSSAAPTWGSSIVSGTAVASTSGTSIDFTSIPSWVKRITVMLSGVSTNGTSNYLIQLGTSGGVVSTGYLATSLYSSGASVNTVNSTAGFNLQDVSAASLISGTVVITTLGANIWVANGSVKKSTTTTALTAGDITLGGVLDRVRITTAGGTDTFDAGSINILYE